MTAAQHAVFPLRQYPEIGYKFTSLKLVLDAKLMQRRASFPANCAASRAEVSGTDLILGNVIAYAGAGSRVNYSALQFRFNFAPMRVAFLLALTLGGCAMQVETPREPPPTNYRQVVAEYIRKSFFDPYTIRDAGIAAPRPGWGYGGTSFGDYKTGWAICVRANAKNRMGAYGGSKETIYVVQDGRVVASGQDLETSAARSGCEGAQYEPFPEIEEQVRRR